jgi:hypothetical protein
VPVRGRRRRRPSRLSRAPRKRSAGRARGSHHGTKPPFGSYWRRHRAVHRLSRLRLALGEGHRHGRRDPEGQRLRDRMVRQEPQRAGMGSQHGGPFRPMAERTGLSVLLRIRRRRYEPVAAERLSRHDAAATFPRQPDLQPHYGDGRRGDRLHEAAEPDGAGATVLRVLRAGGYARAAPPHEGVGRQIQGQVRSRLERRA